MGKYWVNSYGNVYGNPLVTPVGRLALASLARPSVKFRPPKFQAHLLFNKNDAEVLEGLRLIQAMVFEMMTEKFGLKADGTPNAPAFKYPWLREGDEKEYQGFGGTYYIKGSSAENKPPEILGLDGKTKMDPNQLVNGMKIRAVVTPMIFDDGIAYQLLAVQFAGDDGTRYYGGPDPKSFLGAIDGAPLASAGPNLGAVAPPVTQAPPAAVVPPQAAAAPVAGVLPPAGTPPPQAAAPKAATQPVALNLSIPATPPPAAPQANGQSTGKGKAAALNML